MTDPRGPSGSAPGELRRLLAGFGLASVAIGLPWPLLLALVWDRYGAGSATGSGAGWAVGLTGAARMAPYVLLSWAAGTLGDRYGRDRLIRVTSALRAGCLAGVAAAVATGRLELAVVAAALAVVAATPTYPAVAAAVPTLAAAAGIERQRALATLVTVEVTAWVVGPALGGLLLAPATRPWAPACAVVLAVAGWLLLRDVRLPGPAPATVEETDAPGAVRDLLRHVAGSPSAVGALGLAALLNLVEAATGLSLLPLVREDWGGSDAGFGVATACLGFGALGAPLLGRLPVGRLGSSRLGSSRLGLGRWAGGRAGVVAIGLGVTLVAATPFPAPALPVLAGLGAVGVLVESRVTESLQDAVAERHRSGVLGIADTVMVAAYLVGGLAAPPLSAAIGARPGLLVIAAVAVLGALGLRGRVATPVLYDASGGIRSADPGTPRDPIRDPIREARRQWVAHGWAEAADGMAMVTSLVRAQQLLMERLDGVLRPLGLTFARYEVLRLLSFTRAGALPMTRLGSLLQVHATSVTSAVDRLETQGYVARSRRADDRRVVLAAITEAGRAVVEQATTGLNEVFADPGLPAADLATLTGLLGGLRRSGGDVVG